ncbi:MAG: hypothetical protein KAV42_09285 [Candidatus Krumholzibacteria bacterium]|nr:hypothetical protein [Candidatus Krumholzibacteria bacterium]
MKRPSTSVDMNSEKSKTAEEIFQGMHRELRSWNADIPESPDRMDPILRIMLKLYSSQLSSIDGRIVDTWTKASNALLRSLCPESLRWPVPAFTVIQAEPSDPVIYVDPRTRFFYKEEREAGKTFFFSSLRNEKLLSAKVKNLYFVAGGNIRDISPAQAGSTQISARMQPAAYSEGEAVLYMAVEHGGQVEDFTGAMLFLRGSEEALKQLRWARWSPCIDGSFYADGSFCPGLSGSIDDIFTAGEETIDWGGLRRSSDLFNPLENSFVVIPEEFITPWRRGEPDSGFTRMASDAGVSLPENSGELFWVKIVLPAGGDRAVLQSPVRIDLDCFIAVNRYEQTLFKHTGGNRLIEIEVPDDPDSVMEIISVTDSSGKSYVAQHEALSSGGDRFYNMIEQNGRLTLWFDFSGEIELPPDSITVNYSITSGTEANGISAGKITELYENHPGIVSLKNVIPVSGAIPAKTQQQVTTEISSRLRGRDRAMSFDQLTSWVRTFDERIVQAGCERGVMRTGGGVRKCVVVNVTVDGKRFYSDDEIELLKTRLGSFLKARTSINSQFKLEMIKT